MTQLTPLFIGGTGRSGTTLLRRIMARHPAVVSLPSELRLIVDPDGALDLLTALSTRWSPYRADQALRRFFRLVSNASSPRWRGRATAKALGWIDLTPPPYSALACSSWFDDDYLLQRVATLEARLLAGTTQGYWMGSPGFQRNATILEAGPFDRRELAGILAGFFDDLMRRRAGDSGQTHWVEDTPGNLLAAAELGDLFPTRRLVHMVRDPRDVAVSYRRQRWAPDDIGLIARRIAAMMKRWFALRRTLGVDEYREIRLERLCRAPQAELTALCTFVGLPFVPQLLDVALDQSNQGQWRNSLTPNEQGIVQRELAFVLDEYGYDASV